MNRALRDGYASDPHVDDLVVDLRDQFTPRELGVIATIELAGALALGTAAVLSHDPWNLLGVVAVAMAIAAVFQIRRRRQLIAYRPGGAATAEPPAAVKGD